MEVNPHTALKHRALGVYFKICRNVMKSKHRKLFYADLFAGDGTCYCNRAPLKVWEPPYFRFMQEAKKQNLDLKCFFNDLYNMDILLQKLDQYRELIIDAYAHDANTIYKKIIEQIPPIEWSIFALDPSKHKQLNFSTIENISKHETFDNVSGCNRKPELIITLMTYTMLQNIKAMGRKAISQEKKDKLLKTIDISLGTTVWRDIILDRKYEEHELKVNEILLNIFLEQLSKLVYDTVYFHINQTAWRSVIYYLIFATSVPGAYRIISKNFEPWVKKVKEEKWVKENFNVYKMAKAREEGIRLLDDFD